MKNEEAWEQEYYRLAALREEASTEYVVKARKYAEAIETHLNMSKDERVNYGRSK